MSVVEGADLSAAAEELTWVRVAGYSLEKIHTGVLIHALTRGTAASKAVAAGLWECATKAAIDPASITTLSAVPEVSVGDGANSVIDLLVSFTARDEVHWLGVEMKVDASPRREQLELLGKGVRAKKGAHHAMALLALGAAQVCRVERGLPPGVARLGVDDLLSLESSLLDAGDPAIVRPWLRELAFERARRDGADDALDGSEARHGYRPRTRRAYQLALFARRLELAGEKPWEVSIQSHNVIATSTASWRKIPGSTPPVYLYLELTDDGLCLKAGGWTGKVDPRVASAAIVPRALAALSAADLKPTLGRRRQGQSATICKMPVWQHPNPVAGINVASATWEAEWRAFEASLAPVEG